MTPWIGRAHLYFPSPQRIDFGNWIPSTISSRRAATRAAVFSPPTRTRSATTRPFGPSTICSSDGSFPFDRANPSPAFVGFPSLNAAASGGPNISCSSSGVASSTSWTATAIRRGVAHRSVFPV